MSWGIVAVAGATLVGGYMASESAEDSAAAMSGASGQSIAVQREMYNQTRGDLAPFRGAGESALQRLMFLTGLGGGEGPGGGSLMKPFEAGDLASEPGYKFRLAEGEKAIQRGALARGMDKSTATLKNLMRFNQGAASDEYSAAFGRDAAKKEQQFSMLAGMAGMGQNAAAMTGTAGANMATGTTQALLAGGAARGDAAMMSGAGWSQAIQGGIGNFMYQRRFDDMMKRFPVFSPQSGTMYSQANDPDNLMMGRN